MNVRKLIKRLKAPKPKVKHNTSAQELAEAKAQGVTQHGGRIDTAKTPGFVCDLPSSTFWAAGPITEAPAPASNCNQALENALNDLARKQALNKLMGAKPKDNDHA